MPTQQNPFKYKDGKTEIQSDDSKPYIIFAMWFNLIMKWMFKFTCAYWSILYGLPKLICYLVKI